MSPRWKLFDKIDIPIPNLANIYGNGNGILIKRNVLGDQGSRQEPLVTDGTLDTELVGSTSLRFFFPTGGPLLLRAPLWDHLLLFSLLGSKDTPRGCLGSFFWLDALPADICGSASWFYANGGILCEITQVRHHSDWDFNETRCIGLFHPKNKLVSVKNPYAKNLA